jgi:hypothetical protein
MTIIKQNSFVAKSSGISSRFPNFCKWLTERRSTPKKPEIEAFLVFWGRGDVSVGSVISVLPSS